MRNSLPVLLFCLALPAFAGQWCYVDAGGITHVAPQRTSKMAKPCPTVKGELALRWQAFSGSQSVRFADAPSQRPSAKTKGSRQYNDAIVRYARHYGVDPHLIRAVMAVESGFNPDVVSAKGAVGLMQIMPETANGLSLRLGNGLKKAALSNPDVNIHLGTFLLSELARRYDNNLDLMLAAYNAGEGNVEKYNNQVPPFTETQKYIHDVKLEYLNVH
ncbi:lytic transglycosylase domain-containing protein [Citrobacter sp. Cu233]|uniref:lytic transglycosylase domain-containing protein n=1 Tax=Citrobacter sp. Cu233 TaxID=2985160 RepID=UPI002576AAFC|nr:lytic transglycosylase domain-containing protein [Citrobacter sp. Cu233]MDM2932057.1 lytic transglycosylase domain-containing protein [Citrobacter sp. Cu233]